MASLTLKEAVLQSARNTDLMFIKIHQEAVLIKARNARTEGKGCVIANAIDAAKTGLVHWGYLPLNRMPLDDQAILDLAKRTNTKHPASCLAVILLRPDGSKAAYLLSYMVNWADRNFSGSGFVVIDWAMDDPKVDKAEIARLLK